VSRFIGTIDSGARLEESFPRFEVLSDSGILGFAGFGGAYIRRFFVVIAALTFFAVWPEFPCLRKV
jgi:hypothetical protein